MSPEEIHELLEELALDVGCVCAWTDEEIREMDHTTLHLFQVVRRMAAAQQARGACACVGREYSIAHTAILILISIVHFFKWPLSAMLDRFHFSFAY